MSSAPQRARIGSAFNALRPRSAGVLARDGDSVVASAQDRRAGRLAAKSLPKPARLELDGVQTNLPRIANPV
jgi:hypothetical protein